jgi:ABC-2 type transport system ATP-binding protein
LSKVFSRGFLRKHSFAAVNNVSLTVEAGETFCLIGPNGAGKTTLIRMLLNLIEPTSGSAFIFGESNKAPASRECVGYFPERFKPPPTLTIRQFLYHWGQFSGLAGAQLKSRITELLQAVRLSDKHDVPMKKLSKGMTVRVGLAQAMINDPGLLILDEPTDGLDPLGRVEFREILNGLHSKGKTILINSHLLSEVEQISQRIGIMKKGELLRVDTLGHLLAEKARLSIVFACNSPEIIKALKEQFVVEEKDGLMAVQLSDRSAVDSVLKKLGTHDLVIKNIVESKGALEEEFLSILGNS